MSASYPGRRPWSAASFFVLIAVVAVMYFAQDVIMPVALAVLLSFVLAPIAQWFERVGLNRVVSVLVTTVFALSALSGLAYVVGNQFLGLVQDLPQYKDNLKAKIRPLGKPLRGGLDETARTVKELADELQVPEKGAAAPPRIPRVEVVPPPPDSMEQLRNVLGPVMRPLATGGIVIVFLLFMLLERDTLRERLIRMSGADINRTTRAFSEASQRVTRYLAMQTLVNGIEGALLSAGLYAIGVPNAILWGALLMVMRFIPYLGVWVAALFPTLLAVAVFDDWTHMLLTAGLIVVLEVVTSQLVEPLLYGQHTGVSPLALLIAAVFWTWLWGPAGLFLAIPLTVSLVVLGKYMPQLAFLGVLMGDKPVLESWERFYQRLLSRAPEEAEAVVEEMLKSDPPRNVADEVLIPAIAMAERDHYRGALGDQHRRYILAHADDLADDLFRNPRSETGAQRAASVRVLCLPVQDEADEIGATLFSRALDEAGMQAHAAPAISSRSELVQFVERDAPDCVCVCAFPPTGIVAARRICRQLHERMPELKLLVALWDLPEVPDKIVRRFSSAGAETVFTRLGEGVALVRGLASAHSEAARRSDKSAAHA